MITLPSHVGILPAATDGWLVSWLCPPPPSGQPAVTPRSSIAPALSFTVKMALQMAAAGGGRWLNKVAHRGSKECGGVGGGGSASIRSG